LGFSVIRLKEPSEMVSYPVGILPTNLFMRVFRDV